jgi:hypothetical protein
MKRMPTKKGPERRKRARSKSHSSKTRQSRTTSSGKEGACQSCSKDLRGSDKALFVEEEIGRTFCSEECIANYFTPEIDRLEKDYFRKLSPNDLSGDERESLAHLRWITLQEPDESWREKTLSGDFRYTLISEFQPQDKKIWCICICLFLRGEPSFLYLAFATRNAAMANSYRKGERVQLTREGNRGNAKHQKEPQEIPPGTSMDGLASAWTEDETLRAQLTQERRSDDIPHADFSLYQSCLEETLEGPDEVWSVEMTEKDSFNLYHFLRFYPDENPGVWYIIVARETEDEEQIEILDAFPTRDSSLVDRYRRGHQEIGTGEANRTQTRVVH